MLYGCPRRWDHRIALAAVLGLMLSPCARAQQRPLWEFGMGLGGAVFNDYRGATSSHGYPLPVPYFIYRGDLLRSDSSGVRGLFLQRRLVEFNVSVNAAPPVFNSPARAGMPSLYSSVEVGPALQWHLWAGDDRRLKVDLLTPVRDAITLSGPPHSIGWRFTPALNLDYRSAGIAAGWDFGLLAGPEYADRRYHEYYYQVTARYATGVRPAYDPSGGYSGAQLLVSASRRFPRYWIGAYLRHDWLQGAAFATSPLVQTHSYWSTGIGYVWMISASSRMVESDE